MFLNTNKVISGLRQHNSSYNMIIHMKIQKEQSFNAEKFNLLDKTDVTHYVNSLNHKGYRINNYWIINGTIF